jgi:transposase
VPQIFLAFGQDVGYIGSEVADCQDNFMEAKVEERNAHIISLYQDERRSLADIGNVYGLTRERVRQIIARYEHKNGVKFRRNYARIWKREAEVLSLIGEGLNQTEIHKRTGLCRASIRTITERNNLPSLKPGPKLNIGRDNQIRELWQKGVTLAEISRQTGVCYSSLFRMSRRLGLTTPMAYFQRAWCGLSEDQKREAREWLVSMEKEAT